MSFPRAHWTQTCSTNPLEKAAPSDQTLPPWMLECRRRCLPDGWPRRPTNSSPACGTTLTGWSCPPRAPASPFCRALPRPAHAAPQPAPTQRYAGGARTRADVVDALGAFIDRIGDDALWSPPRRAVLGLTSRVAATTVLPPGSPRGSMPSPAMRGVQHGRSDPRGRLACR